MALIVKRPWTSQPQEAVGLNTGNPIMVGLVELITPSPTTRELIKNAALTPAALTQSVGSNGQAITGSGAGSLTYAQTANVSNGYTVFTLGQFDTTSGSRNFCEYQNNIGYQIQIRQDNTDLSFYHSDSTDRLASEAGIVSSGRVFSVVGTWDKSSMRLYRDGVLRATTGSVTNAPRGNPLATGKLAANLTGKIYLHAMWNRALSAGEIASIYVNPWQLFAPLPRRIWVAPAASSGITGSAAAVQSPNSSAATGTISAAAAAAISQALNAASAAGAIAVSGSASLSQAANSAAASGTVAAAGTVTATAALVQAANITAATGAITISSSVGIAQAANAAAASSASTVAGTAASVQAASGAAAAGSSAVAGVASSTQTQNSVTATASVGNGPTGGVSTTQALNTASATSTVSVVGAAATTQAGNITAAAGSAAITGANASTQAPNTTAATAFVGNVISGAVSSLQAANTVTAAAIVTDVIIVVAKTLHQDVQFLLLTLAPAGGVSYAANTQQPPVYPYMTWLRIASTPNVSLRGPSTLQNTRVQIDIYSRNVVEAVALETALEAAFAAWAVQNVPLMSFDLIDPETRAYRVTKEYSVWASN